MNRKSKIFENYDIIGAWQLTLNTCCSLWRVTPQTLYVCADGERRTTKKKGERDF